ncbi:hypothetical protein [Chthonobacter albigriseus]|uniref:hypothetical protein n=1 Tax=Chthonobacter albigriseus TaxID=1683161 RepID=UPI0015EECB53|nr:hypothetical protein [Chthonobacter albigriseus]
MRALRDIWARRAETARSRRYDRLGRRARLRRRIGGAFLGLLVGVPAGVAGLSAMTVMNAKARLSDLTAELALAVAAVPESAELTADRLWSERANGRLVWIRTHPGTEHRPDAVGVSVGTEIELPLLATVPPLAHWTVETTAAARRTSQSSASAEAAPSLMRPAEVISAAYAAVFQTPVALSAADVDRLADAGLPVDRWLAALADALSDETATYGQVAARRVPAALLVRAAADVAADGALRNTLVSLAESLHGSPATLSAVDLVELGSHAGTRVGAEMAPPATFRPLGLLAAMARRIAADGAVEVTLDTADTALTRAVAEVSIGSPEKPVPPFAGTRRLPAVIELPSGWIALDVQVLGTAQPLVGTVTIPVLLEVRPGRVDAQEPDCRFARSRPLEQTMRADPGAVVVSFGSGAGQTSPARIFEDVRVKAWVLGRSELEFMQPTDLRLGGGRTNPTTRVVREPRDLSDALDDLLSRADVRIAVGEIADDPANTLEASRLRSATGDLIRDAGPPIERYLQGLAAAFGLPAEGVLVAAGHVSCHAAEPVEP